MAAESVGPIRDRDVPTQTRRSEVSIRFDGVVNAVPISVIVPTRDRHELLAGTLRSILAGNAVPAEIVVIDQSRTRWTEAEQVPHPPEVEVRYFWSRSSGVSRARNDGITRARHQMVALVDDDVEVSAGWLDAIAAALVAGGPRTAVTGRVLPGPTPSGTGYVPSTIANPDPAIHSGRVLRDVLYSGNFALWRDAVADIGGFDERLGPGARWASAEDNDFGFRLLEAEYEIRYVPEAALTHLAWRSPRQLVRLRWNYGRGQGGFYGKHARLRDPWAVRRLRRDLRSSGAGIVRHARSRDTWAVAHAAFLAGLVLGFAEWIVARPAAPATLAPGAVR